MDYRSEAVSLGVSAYNSISNWLSSDESGSTGGSENSKAIDWNNPPSPENLGEEWQETTSDKNKSGNHRKYTNSETGEVVTFDKGKPGEKGYKGKDHYHRNNPGSTGKKDKYLDKDGNPVEEVQKNHI